MYECVAENEVGRVHASAQLIVHSTGEIWMMSKMRDGFNVDGSSLAGFSGSPLLASPPLSLRTISVGSREATIAWNQPKHTHGTLMQYHIFYKEKGSLR